MECELHDKAFGLEDRPVFLGRQAAMRHDIAKNLAIDRAFVMPDGEEHHPLIRDQACELWQQNPLIIRREMKKAVPADHSVKRALMVQAPHIADMPSA